MIRRLSAFIKKEFYQIIRDPSSIMICVILPAILLFIYGTGVSLDMNLLKIGVVLEDTSPNARNFLESLTDSKYFEVHMARDRRELDRKLTEGAIRGIVVIPFYFTEYLLNPDKVAPIQVIADASEPNTASFVQNYVQGAWAGWMQQSGYLRNLIQPINRVWYNEELESRYFLLPGSLGIIMALIGTLLTALVVAREWERGTMEALLATPIRKSELILGKTIPYFILGTISMVICFLAVTLIYHVPFRGSFFALMLVSSVFLLCSLGMGLMISTISKNQFIASQAAMVSAFLPTVMLSGFIFEISSMPWAIQMLTYILPARYFVSCMQTIFLVGDVWPLLIPNILMMAAIGALFFLITIRKTVKRLD